MAKTKPTVVPVWIPDNATNIVDPGSKATNGYVFQDPLPSSYLNYHLNRVGQWMQYANRQVDVHLYINQATGNDTTGNGTVTTPYATLNKALTECGEGGVAIIEDTNVGASIHELTSDHTLKNQDIQIISSGGGITVRANTKAGGGGNIALRGFDMYNSTVTIVGAIEFGAIGAGETWDTVASMFRAGDGKSTVHVFGTLSVASSAGAIGQCYFVQNTTGVLATIDLWIYATITTSSRNYIFDSAVGTNLYAVGGDAAIDDTDYWIRTQTSVKPTYYFDFKKNAAYSSGLRRAAAGGPESITPKAIRGLPFDGSVCTADENNAAWATGIEAAASNFQSSSSAPAKVGKIMNITCTQAVSGNFIEGLTVEIDSGGLTGSVYEKEGRGLNMDIPFYLYVAYFGGADTCNFFPYMISKGERNPGLTTNVESLK